LAFTGNRRDLVRKINVSSSGLLLDLLDKELIFEEQYECIKVTAKCCLPLAAFL